MDVEAASWEGEAQLLAVEAGGLQVWADRQGGEAGGAPRRAQLAVSARAADKIALARDEAGDAPGRL